jgi:hypothetical protein
MIEAVRSRFDPGNRLPWDVRVLFKTRIHSFIKAFIGKSTSVLLTLWIPALGCPLINRCCSCAGVILRNGCRLANRLTYAGGAAHFTHSHSTLQSGVTGLTLNFGQRMFNERQENIIHATLSELSRQRAGCMCALVNIKCFDYNKRGCLQ